MDIQIAPVQGHTDAAWRHFHSKYYGGAHEYYTPFIRLEKGEFRKHDLKDYLSELNRDLRLTPQVIFRNIDELKPLVEGLIERGAKRIDLNSGCPFPLQTAKGRGAAFIGNKEGYSMLPGLINQYPEVSFSIKMRLGMSDSKEWHGISDILNNMTLNHITLHPRVARQQYGGEPDYEEFVNFLQKSKNPVIYNGDIKTPEDIKLIIEKFPGIKGIMLGRGILGRPSLASEFNEEGKVNEWNEETRLNRMLEFQDALFDYYSAELCGDHQVLSKIKPFWEYAENEIGRKAWKSISKSGTLSKYRTAVSTLR